MIAACASIPTRKTVAVQSNSTADNAGGSTLALAVPTLSDSCTSSTTITGTNKWRSSLSLEAKPVDSWIEIRSPEELDATQGKAASINMTETTATLPTTSEISIRPGILV